MTVITPSKSDENEKLYVMAFDDATKEVAYRIQRRMDDLDTTTDAIQLFVNHWGRWCAKVVTHKTKNGGRTISGFGDTVQSAMDSLEMALALQQQLSRQSAQPGCN